MPPKKLDSQLNLSFLFDMTRIMLSLPSVTPITSLPSLLLPPLELATDSLPHPPQDESSLRVCRRIETKEEGHFTFVPLKSTDGTIYKALGGNQNELLFIQFQHPETLSWLPIKATVPSIDDAPPAFDEEDDEDEDDLVEVVDEDEDAPIPSSAKGKGRG